MARAARRDGKPDNRVRRTIAARYLAVSRRDDEERVERHLPATRGDCATGVRPCPYLSCRHHLAIDITIAGSVRLARLDVDLEQMGTSCALDVADDGPRTLDFVGNLLGLTRERVRQIEIAALHKLRTRGGDL